MTIRAAEIRVSAVEGSGYGQVVTRQCGYLDKLIVVIPTDLTADVSVSIQQGNAAVGAETVFAKAGMTAGTYHIYPSALSTDAGGVADDDLKPVRPIFQSGDSIRLTLANASAPVLAVVLYAILSCD